MMNKKKEEIATQKKSAQVILSTMKEESSQEIAGVLQGARREAEKIIQDASDAADRARAELLEGLRTDQEKIRERIFSGLALEKKRLLLEEKDQFVRQVLDAVKENARGYRGKAGYAEFLTKAAAEGVRVIGQERLEITYAYPDEKLFSSGEFIAGLQAYCRNAAKKETVTFTYTKGDFEEIGLIVSSPGGAVRFDNRFSSRLARVQADIYATLLKESF